MKTAVVAVLGLLGALCLSSRTEATTAWDIVRQSAANWTGVLPCGGWDCECEFRNPKGCCCVAGQLFQLEEATFMRMVGLWKGLTSLNEQIDEVTGGRNIAFAASMTPITSCFGPFTRNVSMPYQNITLNQGYGYNGALGAFTAPHAGLYSFSYTVYSSVGPAGERIYHKVQLVKDGQVIASSWEDNREDSEDSATQTVLLQLRQGNQVYVELVSGRFLCADSQGYNSFSGFLVYPLPEL
ncbi:cerebellin 18 [Salminus brasiliensis]|uniref:cerebellin 18 n=1 Tax=Salminus brasiliensis TaxID=930266 RepID=UPI003B833CC7